MKRKNLLIILFTIGMFLTACDKGLLETSPYNSIGSSNMWTNESLSDLGVIGVYQTLRSGYVGVIMIISNHFTNRLPNFSI